MLFATQVQAVSESLAEEVISLGLARKSKITVVGPGSSNGVVIPSSQSLVASASEARIRLHIPDVYTVGFVGRLHQDKGVECLLKAFDQVSHGGLSAQLLLIGPEEPSGYLDALLDRHPHVRCKVIRTGPVPDPAQFYGAMDLLCLPTRREGFPNVVLEAAAWGVPTIASRVTGCVDAVVDHVTGYLYPVDDYDELAEKIVRLTDEKIRERMGRAARDRVTRYYDRTMIWQLTEQAYRRESARRSRTLRGLGRPAKDSE